eukprot:CAMPEP_0171909382 /NCGR_PEP_ID=MMETSP0993-20121228/8734_1 /TAXON_ID=483369 /ORGANISM="non described non described, Strain CCMP2098" /LENGTH=490 /DNA_ID=CAMNT_0012542365 /DNA_START=12 /DNA_END=1484 /DNA_ORIENTATION=-
MALLGMGGNNVYKLGLTPRFSTTNTGDVALSSRSIAFLKREKINTKSMELMFERKLSSTVDKKGVKAQQEECTRRLERIESTLLKKLSDENPFAETKLGKGSLARRELGLSPSRVLVSGAAGVLAGLIYGKLQRVTGTGATNNAGLKHPNALCTSGKDKDALNAIMAGRFMGGGCWHEVTELPDSAWDLGLQGLMDDIAAAVAGDERPFVLVPRDGCDVVVLGSRYTVKGSYKWGISTALDFGVDPPPVPDLGPIADNSSPAALGHLGLFKALVAAAAEGLNPKDRTFNKSYLAEQHSLSSTRGCASHLVCLLHPRDLLEPHLKVLQASGVPFTCVVTTPTSSAPPPSPAGGGGGGGEASSRPSLLLSTDVSWTTNASQLAGAPGRPSGELAAPLRVQIVDPDTAPAVLKATADAPLSSNSPKSGVSQESVAELITQAILLLDAAKSRVIVVSAAMEGGVATVQGGGTVFPAGVSTSEQFFNLLNLAGEM